MCETNKQTNTTETQTDSEEIIEIDLVRDLMYVLQGIDGKYLKILNQPFISSVSKVDPNNPNSGINLKNKQTNQKTKHTKTHKHSNTNRTGGCEKQRSSHR